jgi:uncharacterized protein (TIGR02186 family)
MRSAVLLAATLLGLAAPARAERLVISLSSQQVAISSNYTGTAVTLFGIVERDAQSAARSGSYDAVITVKGPREAVTVRRKAPFGPIWLNRDQQKFADVPALLGIYATRPLEQAVSRPLLRKSGIGLEAALAPSGGFMPLPAEAAPFQQALVRLRERAGLYRETGTGVAFITDTFFRARVPLPASAPLGPYNVEVALLADGVVLARENAPFVVMKAGFEAAVSETVRDHALLYGLGTCALALGFGWLASVIFRRD